MLTIFPFETDIYKKAGVPCTFVGHPLLDILPPPAAFCGRNGSGSAWKIGILPGSRPQEIIRHLPLFLAAFRGIWEVFPKSTAHIFAVPEISDDELYALFGKTVSDTVRKNVVIVREQDYELRRGMDFAFTSSGTATLENALLGLPMAVAYKMPWLTYRIAKKIIRVPYISLVNILAGREMIKEYVQKSATPENLSGNALAFLQNPGNLSAKREELLSLRKLLGEAGASDRAAKIIIESL